MSLLAQAVEVRGHVTRHRIRHTEIRHGGPGLDCLRIDEPAHQVLRGVRNFSGDERPPGECREGGRHHSGRRANSRNRVTGTAAPLLDVAPAAGHAGGLRRHIRAGVAARPPGCEGGRQRESAERYQTWTHGESKKGARRIRAAPTAECPPTTVPAHARYEPTSSARAPEVKRRCSRVPCQRRYET